MITERIPTGITELDEMIEGGFIKNSTNLVLGPAGAGKTILSMMFLCEGARKNERGLLVTLQEGKNGIIRDFERFRFFKKEYITENKILVLDYSPSGWEILDPDSFELAKDPIKRDLVDPDIVSEKFYELSLPAFLQKLLYDITEYIQKYQITRIVLDPISAFVFYDYGQDPYILKKLTVGFLAHLQNLEVTTIAISETDSEKISRFGEEYITDSVIVLESVVARGEMIRIFRILKMRGTAHSLKLRKFRITDNGIEFLENDSI